MERVAQGRVWTGRAALEGGLVDRLGGLWSAVSVAKWKAGIDASKKVGPTCEEGWGQMRNALDLPRREEGGWTDWLDCGADCDGGEVESKD